MLKFPRHIWSLLATPAMLGSAFSAEFGSFSYEPAFGGGVEITDYSSTGATEAVVPDTIDAKPVVSIGNRAFENAQITSISLPDSLIEIGTEAFSRCSKLATDVVIPESVIRIEVA